MKRNRHCPGLSARLRVEQRAMDLARAMMFRAIRRDQCPSAEALERREHARRLGRRNLTKSRYSQRFSATPVLLPRTQRCRRPPPALRP
jgi:hypothetical protein